MNEKLLPVAPLHRVSLALSLDGSHGPENRAGAPQPLSFIFGIASDGMSPFEYALLNKVPGEEVQLRISADNRREVFAHLDPSLDLFMRDLPLPVRLRVRVTAVSPASPREIVQAMASVGGCGCGCGCH